MSSAKRPLWRYPLFQFPAIALGLCLFLGAIEYLLRLGCYPFWILLFLLLAWAVLMWVLVMPLDHVLQDSHVLVQEVGPIDAFRSLKGLKISCLNGSVNAILVS